MPASNPTVGVAVTTHGRPIYLAACLASLRAQTRRPDLVVVSEDGHDPETAELISAAGRKLTIRHLRNAPPLGERRNRRQALSETHTDFVAILDGDDEWEPRFLEVASAALSAHPDCGFCAADHWLINGHSEILEAETDQCSKRFGRDQMESGVYDDVLLRHLNMTSFSLNSSLFRRGVLASIKFVPGGDTGTGPDYSIFLNLGAKRVRAWYLHERLGRYRVHEEQITRNRVVMASSGLSALQQVGSDYQLTCEERSLLVQRLRFQVLELAIAHAHRGERRAALAALLRLKDHGLRGIAQRRLIVLGALLLGMEPLLRGARRMLSGIRSSRETVAQ
jgi:glycosyltransferase involved in cell wall biosynthesis